MTARPQPQTEAEAGLTLLELVVAMAIFALVAVMGMQALSGALRLRDDLAGRAARVSDLSYGLALLRYDLNTMVPMLFYPPDRAPPQSALVFAPGGQRLAVSVGARPRFPPEPGAAMGRVEYRLEGEGGRLLRRSWPGLTPASAAGVSPDVTVLEGVSALRLRSYWPQLGWVAGAGPAAGLQPVGRAQAGDADRTGAAPEVYSSTLPLALELTLVTRSHGEITLLETLQ